MPSPDVLTKLLDLQARDLKLDQLRHRHETLPDRSTLAALDAERHALDTEASTVEEQRHSLGQAQKRLEDEVASLRAHIAAENDKLYSGSVTSPRELQAIQDEIASLERRAAQLEDETLEYMEQAEPLDEQLAAFAARRDTIDRSRTDVAASLAQAEEEIDAEIAAEQGPRDAILADIDDPDLLAEYHQLRKARGGVGVARLVGSTCDGCHLTLAAREVDQLKHAPAGTVGHCEECGRILVP